MTSNSHFVCPPITPATDTATPAVGVASPWQQELSDDEKIDHAEDVLSTERQTCHDCGEASEDDIASVIVAAQTSNANICAAAILAKFIVTPRAALPASPLRGRDMLRSICKAGGELGCSCADQNYQWFDWQCQKDIVMAFKRLLSAAPPEQPAAPASPLRGREIDQQWIKSLIHCEYDPKPSYYKPGDDWNDGTDEIAKRIAERYASPPEQPAAAPEMFKCNCPFEVRSGCSEPKCPHYVKSAAPAKSSSGDKETK